MVQGDHHAAVLPGHGAEHRLAALLRLALAGLLGRGSRLLFRLSTTTAARTATTTTAPMATYIMVFPPPASAMA